jgi:predicted  nucleic acid-binding Zn-ribbon protein
VAAPGVEAVLALQELDTDLDRHRHRRATLPERTALADIDERIAAVTAAAVAPRTALAEVATRQAALEADLAATETRIAQVERRMYSGEVTASRELQAMADDTKALQSRRSDLEDRVLAAMDERQPPEDEVTALDERLVALASEREQVAAALTGAEQAVDSEIADLTARRAERAAAVPPDLLATYERLRARLGGVGAARLVGDRCDGCHLTLPAAEVDRIRRLPEGEIITCEDCGRILVP